MSQQVEKEFKNLLTKEEFERLLVDFNLLEVEPLHQTNFYYDSKDGALRALHMGLRIRLYDDKGEQTLKSPISKNEKLETTDELSLEEATTLADNGKLKTDGYVAALLRNSEIEVADLEQIGQLSTIRYEVPVEGGVFFLDESYYQDQKDYELEFEAEELETGALLFEQFLESHQINHRHTAQKIERALNYPNS
ncbi:CYTH domain-containing protein [Jeotgalibaca caeni]|uniref:CYTH domain-containing protein n=1 Tax=Jeotgalibaca caeni TaxID=3028623 RepID=UPI00237DDB9A|nr:CYTH domain-containing protein [Jeotgalibaca caeni]MDE1547970.1 CYTH domain-containing protein [Jeotgalibaca caeni]